MSDDDFKRLESMVKDLHTAVIGPSDGSRQGLVGTCILRQALSEDLRKRVEVLEKRNRNESARTKIEPAGIAAVVVGIVEAAKYLIHR